MVENYSHLAEIYDFVMRRVHYDRWNEYLYYVTKEHLDNNPKILEIAAGKGNLTRLFSRYYKGIISTEYRFICLRNLTMNMQKYAAICLDYLSKINLIWFIPHSTV
ncbi:MAG: hypothetical protein EHM47_17755 [Ignavibacteriales bacterium]|nr:MAG: hypothetical protein EHM47_17755 [Ignavibacteriales bacterium]